MHLQLPGRKRYSSLMVFRLWKLALFIDCIIAECSKKLLQQCYCSFPIEQKKRGTQAIDRMHVSLAFWMVYRDQLYKMKRVHLFIALTAFLLLLQGCSCCLAKQYYDSGTSSCRSCPYSCYSCTDSNTCNTCISGYFLNNANGCQVCSTFYCQTCPSNTCSACIDGYFMVSKSCIYSNNSLSIAYVVGGISLAVIIFVTCLCFCIRRCRERSFLSNIQNSARHIVIQPQAPSLVQIKFDETWNASEGFKSKKEEACPFCLDPQVNLEISCSHLYHIECMARWLTRHNDCPICKRIVTGNAKLYCSLCFGYNISFNSALIPSQKIARKWVCEGCKSQQKQQIEK